MESRRCLFDIYIDSFKIIKQVINRTRRKRMTLEEKLIKKFGRNRAFMYLLKLYKECAYFFWGIKKEMAFHEKIVFLLTNRLIKRGRRNVIKIEKAKCRHNLFTVIGNGNQINIGVGSQLKNIEFEVRGNNNYINIGKNVSLKNSTIAVGDNGSFISIGDGTSIGKSATIVALESAKIRIGSDCLFSSNISIRNSDSHSIIDLRDNYRRNAARDITIGNHVWLGENVTVLKGVEICDDVVIGNRSMLTKGCYQSNNIYAGFPVKLLRGGVSWCAERIREEQE